MPPFERIKEQLLIFLIYSTGRENDRPLQAIELFCLSLGRSMWSFFQ